MLNRVVLMGRLTDNPELRHTSSNIPVTTFTIACERNYRSGDERITDFLDIVAWRNTAEFVSKYFKKGNPIIVVGELQTRSYEDKQKNKRTVTEVVADEVSFAGNKENATEAKNEASAYMPSAYQSAKFEEIEDTESLPF